MESNFIPTHPSWHNHGNGLNQTLEGDQFVEAVHLASCHIHPVLWHHTCRQEKRHVVMAVLPTSLS